MVSTGSGNAASVAHNGDRYVEGAKVIEYLPPSLNTVPSSRYYLWLMAPALILLAAISLYPFFWLIWMSLQNVGSGPEAEFIGLKNYVKLWTDDKFWLGWVLLFKYSFFCMLFEITIGVFLAVVLNGHRFENILITIFLMPMMMAPAIAGLVWYYLFNSTFGWYHWLFQSLGILGETSIIGSTDTAMAGIVMVDIWQWTPLITLITLAGMKRVPRDQLEANMVDGASAFRNFVAITLPNIYPFLLIAIMLRFMDNFRFIDVIMRLTGGGPAEVTKVLPVYLFDVSFVYFKLGRGSAIALTLLIVTIIFGKLLVRVFESPASKRIDQGN